MREGPPAQRRRVRAGLALGLAGLLGLGALAWALPGALAPVASGGAARYPAAVIGHGRVLVALGDCAVCHTAPGGAPFAGGRAIATPFGIVHSTNITPDRGTGIGGWSFAAFRRAMRTGVARNGQHLYPVFPYNHFTKTTDADLEAIYAYLRVQTPVVAAPKPNGLAFPMTLRPLLAVWNALYLTPGAYRADPARSAAWNRGAYLVEGLGHCEACHTPRNALGAEIGARAFGGGMVEGWAVPALGTRAPAPVPWTEEAFYTFLRTGFSAQHGPAAGPMGPVIRALQALPDADLRAMAQYLAALSPPVPAAAVQAAMAAAEARNRAALAPSSAPGARIFRNTCAFCHAPAAPVLFGVKPDLAFNSNLQAARPDNLIRIILGGVPDPAVSGMGPMPAFGPVLPDSQVADLVGFLRRHYAPGRPGWTGLDQAVARLRALPGP